MQLLKKYKIDITYFSVLSLLFLFFSFLFFEKTGDFIIDCGREAYFPLEVLKGKILYRDIFNIFAPLSYQINALFYHLWGVNLSVLDIAGIINAFITMIAIYLICRTITKPINAVIICFAIMVLCFFKTFIQNFIFPYTFSIVYAISSFLISILFCIYYFIKPKPYFMILSCFFIGLSITFKYDFILFPLILTSIMLYFKPLSKRNIFLCILSFLSTPLISLGLLFYQGLTFQEFINAMQLIYKFASTKTYNTFLYNLSTLYFNPDYLKIQLSCVEHGLKAFSKYFCTFYIILFIVNKILAKKEKFKNYITIFLCTIFISIAVTTPHMKFFIKRTFPFLGYATVILAIIMLLYIKFGQNIEKKDKIFLFLIITAIISATKSFFFLDFESYGTFLILLIILVNFIFILDYLPKFFKFIDKTAFQYTFISLIIASLTLFLSRELNIIKFSTYKFKTERATI